MSKLIFEPATFLRFLNVILLLTFDLPFDLSLSNLIIDIKVKTVKCVVAFIAHLLSRDNLLRLTGYVPQQSHYVLSEGGEKDCSDVTHQMTILLTHWLPPLFVPLTLSNRIPKICSA